MLRDRLLGDISASVITPQYLRWSWRALPPDTDFCRAITLMDSPGDKPAIRISRRSHFYDDDGKPILSPAHGLKTVADSQKTEEIAEIVRQTTKDINILGVQEFAIRKSVGQGPKKELTIVEPEEAPPEEQPPSQHVPTHGEEAEEIKAFIKSEGLSNRVAEELLKKFGRNELEEKKRPRYLIFLDQLYQPMPIMIWIAAFIEAAIQQWIDMGILLGIQFLNASVSYHEITKAGDAVAVLKASLKPLAHVKRDGKVVTLDAALLVPGDLVLLAAGGAVPADCLINHGQVDIDQAALTGESLPVTMYEGSSAKMGSTVVRGEVEATVEATGSHTFFGKTAALLQQPQEYSNMQKLLITLMMILVILSVTLCTICLIYLLVNGESLQVALSFTVVLLVASIPVAIEIVCTCTLALGSRELSRDGAIVSRLAAIEDTAGMNMLCSDKTGTLTLNKMVIQEQTPTYKDGESRYSILRYAAMAAKWNDPPRDALDTLVLSAVDMPSMEDVVQVDYMPFDPTVKRTEGTIKQPSGATFKTTKGAPHILLKLIKNHELLEKVEADVEDLGQRGIRCLAVAKTNDEGEWEMLGLLTFLDPPRPDTAATIAKAMEFGIEVKMITGDHLLIAKETARQLNMGNRINDASKLPMLDSEGKPPADLQQHVPYVEGANGFAQVFPEHKFLIVEILRRAGYKCGMTGDGVNDAPALKRADVGVAVQGATDAARAAADIILTKPGLSTIVTAIVVSRTVFGRMRSFITYRVAATLQLLVFFFIAVISLHPDRFVPDPLPPDWKDHKHPWPKFFHMPVLMLMLITLLNDGTLISIGYDSVTPSKYPEKWRLPHLFAIASAMGFVACLSSLVLLAAALDSWSPTSAWQKGFHLAPLSYGQITTMVFQQVSIANFLGLFSARIPNDWFFRSKPSRVILIAACVACGLSTLLACVWPDSNPDKIYTLGLAYSSPRELAVYVWIYCIIWWFLQDIAKVMMSRFLSKYFPMYDTPSHLKNNSAEHAANVV